MGSCSYLVANPSFWSGVARAVDLSGKFDDYNLSIDGGEADAIAAWFDWLQVGDDLAAAAENAELELRK